MDNLFFKRKQEWHIANRYAEIIREGCVPLFINFSALRKSSVVIIIILVVPSPISLSCCNESSTKIFDIGSLVSILFNILAPSFVIVILPKLSTIILSKLTGPNEVFKSSFNHRHSLILFLLNEFSEKIILFVFIN